MLDKSIEFIEDVVENEKEKKKNHFFGIVILGFHLLIFLFSFFACVIGSQLSCYFSVVMSDLVLRERYLYIVSQSTLNRLLTTTIKSRPK